MTTETQTPGTAAAADPAASTPSPAPASAAPAAPAPAATASQPEGKSTLLTDDPQSADQKPADAKPAEAEAKPGDKPAEPPAEYVDFATPEGVTLNTDAMTELKAFAKEKGLSQEEAQKLVDLGVKNQQANQQAIATQIEQAVAQWAEQSRTDKEFGGDKLAENTAMAKRALDTFGTPALSAMLKESGLGNHPEIIRAFYRVGQAISEDRLVSGSTKPAASDPLAKMYPTMQTK